MRVQWGTLGYPWEGEIEEILWIDKGQVGQEHEGSGGAWISGALKEMTGGGALRGEVETWCKKNSKESPRMILAKTPSNKRIYCLNWSFCVTRQDF